MKIGLVLAKSPGVSETFFISYLTGLRSKGFQVVIFADSGKRHFRDYRVYVRPGKNIIKIIKSLLFGILFRHTALVRFLRLELKRNHGLRISFRNLLNSIHILNFGELDWIHFGFTALAPGRENVARAVGAKMAVSFRGYDIYRFPLKNPGVYQMVWKNVTKIHTISDDLLNKAVRLGMPANIRHEKITPAVEFEFWNSAFRKPEFGSTIRLLTVSRLHWSKGLEYVIMALKKLAEKGITFHFTVIGDGKEKERYVLAAENAGVLPYITFAGSKSPDQILEYYHQTDIYLQYSVQEGFCNALLEAQAAGLPCISSNAGGLMENIVDRETGWVVPAFEPELLADKIEEVINMDAALRQEICFNAMKRVKEKFDLDQQILKFTAFYGT